jgi:serine protease
MTTVSRFPRLARLATSSVALAATILVPVVASADPSVDLGPPPTATWTDESSWDIPGVVIIDEADGISESDEQGIVAKLTSDFSDIRFVDSDLVKETHIHLALVRASEVDGVMAEARGLAGVDAVEPLAWVDAQFAPNDPLYSQQWHMTRIGAESAWDYATGRGVTVAVVDTGIACEDHGPFMKGTDLADTHCVGGWNFVTNDEHANDDQGHGTHVAGTIAQSTNNGIGAVGVAFDARLMPVKVLNGQGWGTTADVADGIRWAADHGAQVINLSLGGPRNSKVLQDAVNHARAMGVVVVAAAGNSGGAVGFPGGCEGAIGVSASDEGDKLAKFSSRGPEVDIAAPGVNVTQQTICNGGKNKCEAFPAYNGTSMATPHVAGVAALLVSLGVTDPAAVEAALKSSARVVDDSEAGKKLYGAGILDAASAVRKITLQHGLLRLGLFAALSLFIGIAALKKNKASASPLRPSYLLAGLFAGPGLFFFAPLLLSRVYMPVDLLARPLGDMDFYLGASVHKLLPFANALVPIGLSVLTFQIKKLRPFVAGIAAGTAAYLGSVVLLHESASPFFGGALMTVWCVGNALVCAFIARMHLSETN